MAGDLIIERVPGRTHRFSFWLPDQTGAAEVGMMRCGLPLSSVYYEYTHCIFRLSRSPVLAAFQSWEACFLLRALSEERGRIGRGVLNQVESLHLTVLHQHRETLRSYPEADLR